MVEVEERSLLCKVLHRVELSIDVGIIRVMHDQQDTGSIVVVMTCC